MIYLATDPGQGHEDRGLLGAVNRLVACLIDWLNIWLIDMIIYWLIYLATDPGQGHEDRGPLGAGPELEQTGYTAGTHYTLR